MAIEIVHKNKDNKGITAKKMMISIWLFANILLHINSFLLLGILSDFILVIYIFYYTKMIKNRIVRIAIYENHIFFYKVSDFSIPLLKDKLDNITYSISYNALKISHSNNLYIFYEGDFPKIKDLSLHLEKSNAQKGNFLKMKSKKDDPFEKIIEAISIFAD